MKIGCIYIGFILIIAKNEGQMWVFKKTWASYNISFENQIIKEERNE